MSSNTVVEPTAIPILETAKGLSLNAMSDLPYAMAIDTDPNSYYTFTKDGLTYGALFLENQANNPRMFGISDAMLLAIVHHRYQALAKANPELIVAVNKLEDALMEVHENEEHAIKQFWAAEAAEAEIAKQVQVNTDAGV